VFGLVVHYEEFKRNFNPPMRSNIFEISKHNS
jgi:hypothetical protein